MQSYILSSFLSLWVSVFVFAAVWQLQHSGGWSTPWGLGKLNLRRWETTIGPVSPMFFRNALTAKLLYTKQLLSALPLSRLYKMRYEPLFCLSRSFKLVPLAVTSGYLLSFAYSPVEEKYRWKPPNKSSQTEGYQEDLFRYYSGTSIFFIVEWELLDE